MSIFQKDYEDLSAAATRPVGDTPPRQTCQGNHDDGGGLAALPQTFVDTLYRTAFEKRDENMPASTIQLVVNLLVQGFHRKEI